MYSCAPRCAGVEGVGQEAAATVLGAPRVARGLKVGAERELDSTDVRPALRGG